jgi:hypothetical protein
LNRRLPPLLLDADDHHGQGHHPPAAADDDDKHRRLGAPGHRRGAPAAGRGERAHGGRRASDRKKIDKIEKSIVKFKKEEINSNFFKIFSIIEKFHCFIYFQLFEQFFF